MTDFIERLWEIGIENPKGTSVSWNSRTLASLRPSGPVKLSTLAERAGVEVINLLDHPEGEDWVCDLDSSTSSTSSNVTRMRKMRHVVAAGKMRFGSNCIRSTAQYRCVELWVNEYLSGKHGSKITLSPQRVTQWAPLITVAILTPSPASVAALAATTSTSVQTLVAAEQDAMRPTTLFDVLLGRKTLASYFARAPYFVQ